MNLVEVPDLASLCDITRFGGVNTSQVAHAFAVLRILPGGDVNSVLPKNRGGVDFARAFCRGIFMGFVVLFVFRGIAVILPSGLEEAGLAFLDWLGIKGIAPSIAAPEENELPPIDFAAGRRTPLPVKNARADMGVIFAAQLAGLFIESDEAG